MKIKNITNLNIILKYYHAYIFFNKITINLIKTKLSVFICYLLLKMKKKIQFYK